MGKERRRGVTDVLKRKTSRVKELVKQRHQEEECMFYLLTPHVKWV